MGQLTQLEDENVKRKKLAADLSLDEELLQGVIRRKLLSLAGSASWSTIRNELAGLDPRGGASVRVRSIDLLLQVA